MYPLLPLPMGDGTKRVRLNFRHVSRLLVVDVVNRHDGGLCQGRFGGGSGCDAGGGAHGGGGGGNGVGFLVDLN